jgi:hypothetical protein
MAKHFPSCGGVSNRQRRFDGVVFRTGDESKRKSAPFGDGGACPNVGEPPEFAHFADCEAPLPPFQRGCQLKADGGLLKTKTTKRITTPNIANFQWAILASPVASGDSKRQVAFPNISQKQKHKEKEILWIQAIKG